MLWDLRWAFEAQISRKLLYTLWACQGAQLKQVGLHSKTFVHSLSFSGSSDKIGNWDLEFLELWKQFEISFYNSFEIFKSFSQELRNPFGFHSKSFTSLSFWSSDLEILKSLWDLWVSGAPKTVNGFHARTLRSWASGADQSLEILKLWDRNFNLELLQELRNKQLGNFFLKLWDLQELLQELRQFKFHSKKNFEIFKKVLQKLRNSLEILRLSESNFCKSNFWS